MRADRGKADVDLGERRKRDKTEWRGTESRGDGADRKGASRGEAGGDRAEGMERKEAERRRTEQRADGAQTIRT